MTYSRTSTSGLAAMAVMFLGTVTAQAATVPASESFESYTNGHPIATEADWSGDAAAGTVTTNPTIIAELTAYTNAGNTFPLPSAAHEKVLEISEALAHTVGSATGGVVITDLLIMPAQRTSVPEGSTNYQFACYVDTSDRLVVWHRDVAGTTNEWITLTNSPSIETGVWSRVTVHKAYAAHRYKVSIDSGSAIEDDRGWSAAPGGTHPGPWFDMAQTNGYMTRLRTQGDATGYLDDMVFTNRSAGWSGTAFAEAAANDGSIATTNTITLAGDTFVSAAYSAGTHFSTSGVPAGLGVDVSYLSTTQVTVTLTGNASPHTATAGTAAMGLTLENAIFTLGVAADVSGASRSDLSVTLDDPPVLSYTPLAFTEDAGNTGAVGNTIAIELTGDTFVNISPLVANTHYTVSGVPADMSFSVTRDDATDLTAALGGSATSHGNADDTNLVFNLLDAAFDTVAAAYVAGAGTNLTVDFADSPELGYGTTDFTETTANNGAVNGTTISLAVKNFAGTNGTNYVTGGDVTVENLPLGLSAAITRDNAQQATLSFSGTADSHENADSITALTIVFHDGAFVGGGASSVIGYSNGTLRVTFDNAPVLSYTPATFTEAGANNGAVGNDVVVRLADETFFSAAFSAGAHFTTSGVPGGLTVTVTRNGSTQATVSVSGTAGSHADIDDTGMTLSFLDAAFDNVAASDITNSTKSLAFDFNDQPSLAYSRTVFEELSNGTIDNTTPVQITISDDTFTGANGSDFVSAGKVAVASLPGGLTAVLEKDSATQLSATLTGTATAHADSNDVTDLTFTFQNTAITAADADQVTGYSRSDLEIDFSDSTATINVLPYRESFEDYADGFAIDGTNGWQSAVASGAIVTTEPAVVSALTAAFSRFPIETNHTKVLRLTEETTDEIKSGSGGTVYSDLMFYITARETQPAGSTNYQFAMYVNTNETLVVWHRDTSGTPTNTWRTLNSVAVGTGAWHRVTVEKDYATQKYRLYLDGDTAAIANPTSGDDWFNMVGTVNAYMSRVRAIGGNSDVPFYLDDLSVSTELPAFFAGTGVSFLFR